MTRTGMLLGICTLVAACDGSNQLVDTATAASELQSTQCSFGGANACFDTFNSCIAAEGADVQACNDALHSCLPPPPARPDGGMAGGCPGMGGGGGPRGPFGGGHGGPGRPGGAPPPIPSAAASACHDALDACLAASPADPRTCFDTEHSCVGDALRAEFQARCDLATAQCAGSTDAACAEITQRCADGVTAMPASCGDATQPQVN